MRKLFSILTLLFSVASIIVLFFNPNWICRIHGDENYLWYDGIWHAVWVYAHLIRDIFTNTKCISHHGSTMYYVCFWGTIIISAIISFLSRLSKTPEQSSPVDDSAERRERLASTKMERMTKSLARRIEKLLSDILSYKDTKQEVVSPISLPVTSPLIGAGKLESISDIATTISSTIIKNVIEINEGNSEPEITELYEIVASILHEHNFDCTKEDVGSIIELSLSFIDESLAATKDLYK